MRGNLDDAIHHRVSEGSIPAYAGEPLTSGAATRKPWVYPRVCGGTIPPLMSATCT